MDEIKYLDYEGLKYYTELLLGDYLHMSIEEALDKAMISIEEKTSQE